MSAPVKPAAQNIVTAIRWNEAVAYINSITGRDIDDWAGKYGGAVYPDAALLLASKIGE